MENFDVEEAPEELLRQDDDLPAEEEDVEQPLPAPVVAAPGRGRGRGRGRGGGAAPVAAALPRAPKYVWQDVSDHTWTPRPEWQGEEHPRAAPAFEHLSYLLGCLSGASR